MGKQIGIYGGSFDPIHLGHLNLAIEMMEARHLDEVWFCPTSQSPHKDRPDACFEDRLKMVQLALEDIPQLCVLEVEIFQEGPCYTIDTLHHLIAAEESTNGSRQFSLIIGSDAARSFHSWYKPEEIIGCARLLVGCRYEEGSQITFEGSPAIKEAISQGLTSTRVMDISSTEIRKRLEKGFYCGHLLPRKVLDYILAHHLYSAF